MYCTKPFTLKINGIDTLQACGKCINCRKQLANNWTTRIKNHIEFNPECFFLTLTYDNPKKEYYSLSVYDLQCFIKRLRKFYPNKKISYFACGEYGEIFGRPHYHLLIFGLGLKDINLKHAYNKLYSEDIMLNIWKHGINNIGNVEEQSIRYVTGYIIKRKYNHKYYNNRQEEFSIMSKNIGLDALYLRYDDYKELYEEKGKMPRYYYKKIKEIENDKRDRTSIFRADHDEAIRLVHQGKEKTFVEALRAIPRRNKQLELDSKKLHQIRLQRNSL